ncbi:PREDICTED: inter-alpha-trypsin inhibitor heavy chain H5-like [Thamnophis sirtalis]|uniref:Inter-alpha-trypsin inhibitor heavy chain H5-like n=1 Tax=Thamnophis sirtalis TaxID=35019 RepID=A0A6I9Y0B3_9SAUR|nr:PREDICTED: inter-alpha-trypsin inhibitor heavy chain H5-like [Thamnophis sirtalis]
METFKASGLIPRKMEATFILHYEELLRRRLGKYQYTVSIRPQQLVAKLRVEVNILENSGINSLEVLPLQNNKGKGEGSTKDHPTPPPSTVVGQTKTLAKVTFNPNFVQQAAISRNGILADFIIQYDVNRELSVGEVQWMKIGPLRPTYHLIYLHGIVAGTNINDALQTSAKILNDYITQNEAESRSTSILVFLTDGRPTMGETQTSKIVHNLKEAIRGRFCTFTIGIGNDVDQHLLERLALENCGMMRLIPENEDAATLLKGLVRKITPWISVSLVSAFPKPDGFLLPPLLNGSFPKLSLKLTD